MFFNNRKLVAVVFTGVLLLVFYYFCLPKPLFKNKYATVVKSNSGQLLGAKIAPDGQWRFPENTEVPYKFKRAILLFEDEYFYKHIGINPISIAKAFYKNIKAGKVVRGGSTITQQVIRLSRQKKRSYIEKIIEAILATRLEFRFSKDRILSLYSAHAPFGGNVVGLEMAAWRYFGVQPNQLSWAESATLAVLPNAPRLIYPGKNQEKLLKKRNRLLHKLYKKGEIDQTTYELSLQEPLPTKPHPLPQTAPHLLETLAKKHQGKLLQTILDIQLQGQVNEIVKKYYSQYHQSEIYNMAVLVVEVSTKRVLSYVGNTPTDRRHQKDVNIITAPRSTGSTLKPFLYASMLDDGELLPKELVADIPTHISGYTPENFNLTYEGAIPVDKALAKSLNIPFVLLLKKYGIERFYEKLKKLHLTHIDKHPMHYGLSLILGGAESSLWELTRAYANMAERLVSYNKYQQYADKSLQELQLLKVSKEECSSSTISFSAGSIWHVFNAMAELNRPIGQGAWKYFSSSQKVAWKTGTSFGNKDAWAIGVTPKYVVGVWVGNATGEGRPSLTGVKSAAPVMFEVFNTLPKSNWFQTPYEDLQEMPICTKSGCIASKNCPISKELVVDNIKKGSVCSYHTLIHVDSLEQYRVHASCESLDNMVSKSWFVLPPVMKYFYKKQHVDYIDIQPFRKDCLPITKKKLAFIYPNNAAELYLPKGLGGKQQYFVAKVAYHPDKIIYWYLDEQYMGSTQNFHEIPVKTTLGKHRLTVVDKDGNECVVFFEVKR